jgi:hypothetical protein
LQVPACAVEGDEVFAPGGHRVGAVDPHGGKDRLPQKPHPLFGGEVGEDLVGPPLARVGGDAPVDALPVAQVVVVAIQPTGRALDRADLLRSHPGVQVGLGTAQVQHGVAPLSGASERVAAPARQVVEAPLRGVPVARQEGVRIAPKHVDQAGATTVGVLDDAAHQRRRFDRGVDDQALPGLQVEPDRDRHLGIGVELRSEAHAAPSGRSSPYRSPYLRRR